ncbi:MAG: type II secretion system protein N, partial [Gammaproteobacteria bacterium]|nr:type II secretion system protein N [Gammaproteobacteria bacterium]
FFPARIAYDWFAPPALKLAGIDGSVWYGSAAEASAGGIYLRDLQWRAQVLGLLAGKLGYSIAASPVSGFIEGDVALSPLGKLTVRDLTGALPLTALRQLLNNPRLEGSLSVQLVELHAEDGVPLSADGSFEIAKLVNPAWHPYSLGGYRATIATEDDGVVVVVEETDGVVDIDGNLKIAADGSFQFIALLLATNNTPPRIRQAIDYLPFADDGVRRIYRFEGRI